MAKWQIFLSKFDIVFITQKAIKGQVITDHLTKNAREDDYQPFHAYFSDEEILFVGTLEDMNEQYPRWRLFFDGVSNSFGVEIGAILVSPKGKHYLFAAKLRFSCTNNKAEYETCIFRLQMALKMKIKDLIVFSDFNLSFRSLEFRHIPRTRNVFADALTILPSMIRHPNELIIEPIQIQLQGKSAHCLIVKKNSNDHPWYSDIKEFIKTGSYPPDADSTAKSLLCRMSSKFFLNEEVLDKKTFDFGLLRCIDEEEADYMIKEVHNGFMRKCIKCQMHSNVIHAPPIELHNMTAPWPYSIWRIDLIRAIDPFASNGH
ncbi:uncharacterized protein LOC113782420 [Coffea eugenioides]|uniref:uncharacterized protein LOC113782420 n=1 Tax=Coffea eugenioides TaxID=49369 RepID=UPI000F607113|nr:uncharacterized protein LOC113782420 [Coffea eugenioides]